MPLRKQIRPESKRRYADLKLAPALVPKPLWGLSAYRLLSRGASWRQIRGDTLQAAGHRCSICGQPAGRLTCHERWDYRDATGLAVLIGLDARCDLCDAATHMGRASAHGNRQIALTQLCRVNRIGRAEALDIFEGEMAVWKARSHRRWRVAVDGELLRRYPQLRVLLPA
jgi:hypothetical protein